MSTLAPQILDRIERDLGGPGAVITPKDFLDLGTRDAVDQVMTRLVRRGTIKRIGRGLYHVPRVNLVLSLNVPASPEAIVAAIARQSGAMVMRSDTDVASELHVSTQVVATPVYFTSGRSKTVKVGNQSFRMRHVSTRRLPHAEPAVTSALQALRIAAAHGADAASLTPIRDSLSASQYRKMLNHARYSTAGTAEAARQLARLESQMPDDRLKTTPPAPLP